jgi:cell division protein FtsB
MQSVSCRLQDAAMKVFLGILVALLLVLQYRLWFGDGSIQEVWRLREEARVSREEVGRLNIRNQALAAEVADLKSGLEAIEERARAELGMIGEGETFYQFVREQTVRARPLRAPAIGTAETLEQ